MIKTNDRIFLPGYYEIGLGSTETENTKLLYNYQSVFPIFSDDNSRIKKSDNGTGEASVWITRTPEAHAPYANVKAVYKTGCGSTTDMGSTYGTAYDVCFCFNV